jgi:YegS/Rv2252/BmrU family lipid kinase
MPRLLLIANSNAQTVTTRGRDVIVKALSSEYEVQVSETKRHGHAIHVARGAVHEEFDVVVALGGDGTVNEVANGLAGSDVPLGILPGGGTNVLARTLGVPRDIVEATAAILANGHGRPRRVPLGRADGRYFTFGCGVGLDAAIVRQVERRQRLKKAVGEWYYVWSGLRVFFARYDRRSPKIRLSWGPDLEHRRSGLFLAVCQNSSPFTYLGDREFRVCPDADLERDGLDCLSLDSLRVGTVVRTVLSAFGSGRHVRGRHALYLKDQRRIRIDCEEPLPVQMDGEYLGERDHLEIEFVPDALAVLA